MRWPAVVAGFENVPSGKGAHEFADVKQVLGRENGANCVASFR
jgi:hypothetical protein